MMLSRQRFTPTWAEEPTKIHKYGLNPPDPIHERVKEDAEIAAALRPN